MKKLFIFGLLLCVSVGASAETIIRHVSESSSSAGISEGDAVTDATASRVLAVDSSGNLTSTVPSGETISLISADVIDSNISGAITLKTGDHSGSFSSGKSGAITLDVGTGYDMLATGDRPHIYLKTDGTTRAYLSSVSPYGFNIGSGIGNATALLTVASGNGSAYLMFVSSGTLANGEPKAFGIEADGDIVMGASHTAGITFRGQPIIPSNAAPRTNVTPRAAYAQIINTGATPPELCISTGTAVDSWTLSSNMSTPCSN